jgi:hypothetical protein
VRTHRLVLTRNSRTAPGPLMSYPDLWEVLSESRLTPSFLQGAEMVLTAMARQLGPRLLDAAPSLWPNIAGPLLPAGGDSASVPAAQPPRGDPQVL